MCVCVCVCAWVGGVMTSCVRWLVSRSQTAISPPLFAK